MRKQRRVFQEVCQNLTSKANAKKNDSLASGGKNITSGSNSREENNVPIKQVILKLETTPRLPSARHPRF